jgi:hypothetical protein
MYGNGREDAGSQHHHFVFRVSEVGNRDYGRLEYWVTDWRRCADDNDRETDRRGNDDRAYGRDHRRSLRRFDATSIQQVVFSDNPAFTAARRPGERPPDVDTVEFEGTGTWNGRTGFTFRAVATDRGEPGRHHDTFSLEIRDAHGTIVASVSGELDGGNIQSTRLGRKLSAGSHWR